MRILYLNPNGTVGGAEASLLHLWAALRVAKPQWTLSLIAASEGPFLSRADALGVSAKVIPFPRAIQQFGDSGLRPAAGAGIGRPAFFTSLASAAVTAPAYVRRLRRAIREFQPDLLHSNGIKTHLLSVFGSSRDVPVVWHIHEYVKARPVTGPLFRLCVSRCSALVTNSESVAKDVRALCRSGRTVEPVHNGIDTEEFAPAGPQLDLDALAHLPPAPPGTVRVGLVATFARWKGHETFLRSLAMLGPQAPVRGYVVGGPIYATNGSQHTLHSLQDLVRTLGLTGSVGFTGYVDNPAAAVRSLDIVVHASTEPEPFGLVIIEAMACGKAVVVSNAGGVPEIVQDGVNVLAHKPGDAIGLRDRIQELLRTPDLRTRLGKAARRTAEQSFGRERFANEFVRIYKRLVTN
jgi:glycosyltransferase involved in cell wall biosynthesis